MHSFFESVRNKITSTFLRFFVTRQSRLIFAIGASLLIGILAVSFWYFLFIKAPSDYPKDTVFEIQKGETLLQIGSDLKNRGLIKSPFWFRFFVIAFKGDKAAAAGDYIFTEKQNVIQIALRLVNGQYGFGSVKVTVPEGYSVKEIAALLKEKLLDFDDKRFIELAKAKEGYLFPETYFLDSNIKPEEVIKIMTSMFDLKMAEIEKVILDSGRSREDLIKMASLLEGEARKTDTRRIVSGILWKRIELGMPLQVDTVFRYINGKDSFSITVSDLAIRSPYNLYRVKGLPPTAISNPGLDSIVAAATPIKTKYLYFLTDKDGNMHYSESYAEHTRLVEKYLR